MGKHSVRIFLRTQRPFIGKRSLIKICLCAFVLLFSAAASNAQAPPAMSFGENLLSVTFDECMLRGEKSFLAEGFKILSKKSSGPLGVVTASKDIHGAYIFCNSGPNDQTWFNVVVASSSGDGTVPRTERVKLEGRMNATPAAEKTPAAVKSSSSL